MSFSDATIRYTIDGSEPNNQSFIYQLGITAPANSTRTIKAKAFKNGWDESDTGSATYSIWGLKSPIISLESGIYYGMVGFKLYLPIDPNSLHDRTIYYTLDGSTPTASEHCRYEPDKLIEVFGSCTLKAKIINIGQESDIEEAKYEIRNYDAGNSSIIIKGIRALIKNVPDHLNANTNTIRIKEVKTRIANVPDHLNANTQTITESASAIITTE